MLPALGRGAAQRDAPLGRLLVGGVPLGRSEVQPLRVAASAMASAVTRPGAERIPSSAAYRPQSRRDSDTMVCPFSSPATGFFAQADRSDRSIDI